MRPKPGGGVLLIKKQHTRTTVKAPEAGAAVLLLEVAADRFGAGITGVSR